MTTNNESAALILSLLAQDHVGASAVFKFVDKFKYNYPSCKNNLESYWSDKYASICTKIEFYSNVLKELESKDILIKTILDPDFPKKLYNGTDKCIHLFYKGDFSLIAEYSVAVIGTRSIDTTGKNKEDSEIVEDAKTIIRGLVSKNVVIVSGLAIGSDTIAHKACIDAQGKTIAILPSAIDSIYPAENKGLAEEIVRGGGLLVSEYCHLDKFSKYNLPQRDRIQSFVADAVFVIKSDDQGGSMIASKRSIKDGKYVCALVQNKPWLTVIKNYVSREDFTKCKNLFPPSSGGKQTYFE